MNNLNLRTKFFTRSSDGSYGGGGSSRNYGNRGFSPYRRYPPAPVELDQEYNVRIEAMSRQGNAGIARIQGLVIFVDGTKVDDNVRIKIKKIGRGHAIGEIVSSEPAKEQEESSVSTKEQEESSVSTKEQEESSVSTKEQEE